MLLMREGKKNTNKQPETLKKFTHLIYDLFTIFYIYIERERERMELNCLFSVLGIND